MSGVVPGLLAVPQSGVVPPVVTGICDDAATFPPGLAPLPEAVRAHQRRHEQWHANLAGPLVLTEAALPALGPLLADGSRLELSVTLPDGPVGVPRVLATAAQLPVALVSIEVVVPDRMHATQFCELLAEGVGGSDHLGVYVEVPRDARRESIIDGLRDRYGAKFRTGGVRPELYPNVAELAAGIAAVVEAGVPFKATAGLHHAVRNTDPETGFDQHGFLNLLLATDCLIAGGSETDAQALLADRDSAGVAGRVGALDDAVARRTRSVFTSFGTCSIVEPLTELIELGVVTTEYEEDLAP